MDIRVSEPAYSATRPALLGLDAIHLTLAVTLAAAAVFLIWPELDLWATGLLYQGGNDFLLRNTAFHRFTDDFIRPGINIIVGLGILAFLANLISRGRLFRFSPRKGMYVAFTFILGPLALVNGILKEFSGRARPKQTTIFGGDKDFTGAFIPADQCAHNCSFVSGDVAFAFATIALALLAGPKHRPYWISASLVFGVAVGFSRMAKGAHFLSDALFAGLFCILIALVLHRVMIVAGWPRAKTM